MRVFTIIEKEKGSDSAIDWPLPKMGGLFVVRHRLKLLSGIVPN